MKTLTGYLCCTNIQNNAQKGYCRRRGNCLLAQGEKEVYAAQKYDDELEVREVVPIRCYVLLHLGKGVVPWRKVLYW